MTFMKNVASIIKTALYVCFVLLPFPATLMVNQTVEAAEPKVILEDYEPDKEAIYAGEEFTLTVKYRNTAHKNIKNLKLNLSNENGDIIPAEGAGVAYLETMAKDSEEEFSFKLKAVNGIEEKSYRIDLKLAYEDTGANSYTVEDSIYVPVYLPQKISVTDIYMDDVKLGESLEVTAKVNNLGIGMVYNVSVKTEGDCIEEAKSYVGNIDSGKSGNIDILAKTNHLTDIGRSNYIIVSYEDKMGNEYSQRIEILPVIGEVNYSDLEQIKKVDLEGDSNGTTIKVVAVVAVLAVIILVFSIVKYRRKKKILEDF